MKRGGGGQRRYSLLIYIFQRSYMYCCKENKDYLFVELKCQVMLFL